MQSKSHLDLNPYTNIILCVRIYYMYIYIIQIQNYASNQAGLKLHPTSFFFLLVQADADHDLPRVRLEQPPVDMSEASPTSPASVESRQESLFFVSPAFFLVEFWLGMGFLDPEDGWGWFSWLYIYTVYCLCVCVFLFCFERIGSLMMTMPASMSVNLLLEISDVPTPPMRRFPHHAVQWCLTAHVGGCNATWTRHGSPMETAVSMAGAPAMAAEGKPPYGH